MIRFETDGETWRATADVAIGVEHRQLTADLGRLAGRPDPGGLRACPVVTVAADLSIVVRAGAMRAGKSPTVIVLPPEGPSLGGQLLTAVAEGAELVLVEDGGAGMLELARLLGGRPLPVLPLDDPEAIGDLLRTLTVDVNFALPAATETERATAHAIVAPYEPERVHHLVDVDPRPAFEEMGWDHARASIGERAAAAAGVLAGRLVASNRRWRS